MLRFVHAADLHIDSPLRGLDRYEGAPATRIRDATRRALRNLVDLCIEDNVDLLLLAGDLFDGDWRDYSTGLFFMAQMSRLRAAGIPVVMLRGNHDAESQVTRHLRLPENVVELSSTSPQSHVIEHLNVVVHGQGFVSRSETRNLVASYPPPVPGRFNIGMLHTAVSGRPGHEPYAPCTLVQLQALGYDYWALGHVHAREVLSERPPVVFPGNLQARHVREVGPKGATWVTVQDGGVVELEHRSVDVVRFDSCHVDLSEVETIDEVLEAIRNAIEPLIIAADGRLLCLRVVVEGRTAVDGALRRDAARLEAEVQALANDFGEDLWIESLRTQTDSRRPASDLAARQDALGQLVRGIGELTTDEAQLRLLAEELKPMHSRLPPTVRAGEDGVAVDDTAYLRSVVGEVQTLLLARLLDDGVDS